MPTFSLTSLNNLKSCNNDLIRLFNIVVKYYDCSIVDGFRNKAMQNKAYDEGRSKLQYPHSLHNRYPARAIDVIPYPLSYNKIGILDRLEWCRFYHFIGFVLATAKSIGVNVRSGGDWDGDLDLRDQNFYDLPHWELIDEK
jgi:peptidoglycan L-alanyl-D-glutamate endopeptidase CwlK